MASPSYLLTLKNVISHHIPLSLISSSLPLSHLHQLHAYLLTSGHLTQPHHYTDFLTSLLKSSPTHLPYAHHILAHSLHDPSPFLLNSFIRAHSKGPTPSHAFSLFRLLPVPDHFSLTFLVRAAAQLASPAVGSAVHDIALKRGFTLDAHVHSALVFLYSQFNDLVACRRIYYEQPNPDVVSQTSMLTACAACGDIDVARELFDKMPQKDSIAWNAMIAGYSQAGRSMEALELFSLMQREGVKVSEATFVSVLTVCAHLGALEQGKWVHAFVQRSRLRVTVTLGTALIDMYSKCGSVERAMDVFWEMKERNVYTWTSALSGLAVNGAGKECLELFRCMKEDYRMVPNGVTFVAVLRGCCVSGLVQEGRAQFQSMKEEFGIEPSYEHYGCMVDLFGRAGLLDEAVNFIHSMPVEPHSGAWGALLNACRMYRNIELGKYAMRKILEIQSSSDSAHVLLSNIYAESKNWRGVNDVRELMKAKGVQKEPGCSVMEVDGEVHEFFVGDKSHPRYKEIEVMLGEISRRLKLAGHMAKTNEVLFDIEEEEKEDALCWHSEKLAIAFGLIALAAGATIRIVKNLRVCRDCHDAIKIISNVFHREIVVRDRNRFHHFRNGTCSCGDFW